jgi:hypothetical protein
MNELYCEWIKPLILHFCVWCCGFVDLVHWLCVDIFIKWISYKIHTTACNIIQHDGNSRNAFVL